MAELEAETVVTAVVAAPEQAVMVVHDVVVIVFVVLPPTESDIVSVQEGYAELAVQDWLDELALLLALLALLAELLVWLAEFSLAEFWLLEGLSGGS